MTDLSTHPHQQQDIAASETLRDKVLLYLGSNARAAEFAPLADGIIFHGNSGFSEARRYAKSTRRPVAGVDPERYAKDVGTEPNEMFPETPREAIQAQLGVGEILFAPSRFPSTRDESSFKALLAHGRAFVEAAQAISPTTPVFVPVVIRYDELASGVWPDLLREAQLPVATVFAGYYDPLGSPVVMRGALDVVGASPHTMVLRCDFSIAGLIAHGALSGALGTSSGVRHLRLPSKLPSKSSPDIQAFIPALGAWLPSKTIAAAQVEPDVNDMFACECSTCGPGGDIRSLVSFAVPTADRPALFDRHSAHSAVLTTKRIIGNEDPQAAWGDYLNACDQNFKKLKSLDIEVRPPGMLDAWRQVISAY